MRWVGGVLLLLSSTACASKQEPCKISYSPARAVRGVRPTPWTYLHEKIEKPRSLVIRDLKSDEDFEEYRVTTCAGREPKEMGITEIALSNSGCYGRCPVYSIRFLPDGSVEYFGRMHVLPLGSCRGHMNPQGFEQLECMLAEMQFATLSQSYRHASVVDCNDTMIRVTENGVSRTAEISGCDWMRPVLISALDAMIVRMAENVEWEESPECLETQPLHR